MNVLRRIAAGLLLATSAATALARTPPPARRIALDALDFQMLPPQVLGSGASLLTLHYVDAKHLLVTFNRRRLMPRLAGNPATDVDRNIDAVLVELATGKVLARTSWRVHDPGQYLWSLGEGDFLLRNRDRLTLLSPLAGLAKGEVFSERPFLASNRPIGSILLSPGKDLLMLETLDHSPYVRREPKPSPGTSAYTAAAAAGDQAAETSTSLVQIDFFRLLRGAAGTEVQPRKAGTVGARSLVLLPVDSSGFVSVIDEGQSHWAFNYNRHLGKVEELSPFDSTCHPVPFLVSRSEFVAFGCRGGQAPRELGGFNLRGEEMWEQTFTETFTSPSFSFAPGRFALSRLITNSAVSENLLVPEQLASQIVTVYQMESGRQLFSINCNPLLRASQNFALSPEGNELAVVNGGAIEIYPLPAPSGKERAAIEMAEGLAPERSDAPIRLGAPISNHASAPQRATRQSADDGANPVPVTDRTVLTGAVPAATAPAAGPVNQPTSVPAAQASPSATQLGDVPAESTQPRRPPTLYGPGEKTDAPAAAQRPR